MNKIFVISATTLALSASSAFAESGFYLSIMAGGHTGGFVDGVGNPSDFTDFETETGESYSLGLGYRVNDNFRVEGRLTQREFSIDDDVNAFSPGLGRNITLGMDGEASSTAFSLDAFYDIGNYGGFTPYVKGGIGYAQNSFKADVTSADFGRTFNYPEDEFDSMTYNVGLGASYAVSDNIDLFAEYQYTYLGEFSTGKDSFGDSFGNEDLSVNEFNIGMSYSF